MGMAVKAHGAATVRVTDKATGQIAREVTAHNMFNMDYVAEKRDNLFSPTSDMTLLLSDYDQPPPANGLIFPMGNFKGFGKHGVTLSPDPALGDYASAKSSQNVKHANGLTTYTYVWDFAAAKAIGNIRSLFLYWGARIDARKPPVQMPPVTWKGTPGCSFENKMFDLAAKAAPEYYVNDFYARTVTLHNKSNTLTISGLAYDPDTGHVFVYDTTANTLYEFESIDTDMTAGNVLAEYPFTKARFSRGIVRGGNLFFVSNSADPTVYASSYNVDTVYLHRCPYNTNDPPVLMETYTCAGAGFTRFVFNGPSAFMDDYLIHGYSTSGSLVCAPVIRLVGSGARLGVTGVHAQTVGKGIQRISPNKQVLVSGDTGSGTFNVIIPMAFSHLLLPAPVVKDDQHALTVSYTISIQE